MRASFEVTHKVFKGEALAIEAFETRVLVGRHPDDPARLKSLRSSCGADSANRIA
jgi:4-hydroxybenzoyl-CoA thioesterase